MKIKKLMTLLALTTATVALADDLEYIYWQVDLTKGNPYDVSDFSYATVKESGGSDFLWTYSFDGEPVTQYSGVKEYAGAGEVGKTTDPTYSGFAAGQYADSYIFELWQEDAGGGVDTRVGWASYTYSQLKDYFSSSMAQTGATPLTVAAVPEPTSALLILLGVAGLALRRRKGLLALVAVVSLQLGVFASAANLVYSFQPSADDTYADGTPVKLGERYVLVWLTNGATGVEIAANGMLTDPSRGEIVQVRASSTKKKGRIFTFEVDESVKDALAAKGGNWAVYLLDTRIYGADGSVTLAEIVDDKVSVVNAAKLLDKSVKAVASLSVESDTVKTDKDGADVATAVPADTPQPRITDVEIVDGKVHVKVAQTVPYLQYNLAAGASLDAISGKAAESPRNGVVGDEIELVAPAESGSGFFKVNRN